MSSEMLGTSGEASDAIDRTVVLSSAQSDATEVRFGIRAMLITMAAIAVATSVFGAILRQVPQDARLPLAAYWGGLTTIAIGVAVSVAWSRYRAERVAGSALYRLVPHSYMFPRAPDFAMTLSGICLLLTAALVGIITSVPVADLTAADWWKMLNFNPVYALIPFGAGISVLWWRRVLVTDSGLLVRNNHIAWERCRRWYWDACNKNVAVIASDNHKSIVVKVPAEVSAAIQSLLDAKIRRLTTSAATAQSESR